MHETTFRILDILAGDLGAQTSIRALAEKIRKKYGSAYYANTYNKIQQLAKEKAVNLVRAGKTSLASLNFREYAVADLLTEMEIKKKQELLEGKPELRMLFQELDRHFRDMVFVRSISIIDAEKNLQLRRMELLILLRGHGNSLFPDEDEGRQVHAAMRALQFTQNLKIDYLVLTDQKLLDSLATDELNPVKEMMRGRVTFYGPENFWHVIRAGAEMGLSLKAAETVHARISDADLVYNLARFGYEEMGIRLAGGTKMCVEYTAAGAISQGKARRVEAVPIILAKKHGRVNYDTLFFLAQKHGFSGILLGLLRALVAAKPDKRAQSAIELMSGLKIKEVPADKASILKKMRTYNVIR